MTTALKQRSGRAIKCVESRRICPSIAPTKFLITDKERPMAYDIYDASIPPLIHMLGGLITTLSKGEAHGGIDPGEARLAPDMLPLKNQIYIATDGAKGCGAVGGDIDLVLQRQHVGRQPRFAGVDAAMGL